MRFRFLPWHLFLLACALLLYAAFPTRTYYWDGVLFSLNIESVAQGHASPVSLFHPNHLLYSAFGYCLYRAVEACGFALRAITVLQILNILASIASAAVLYAIAKRLTQSVSTALFCLVLFSFGATWWKFSTDANAYIISVLFLLLAFWFLIQEPPRLWSAGVCHVSAMLFHELAVFAYVAVIAVLLLRSQFKRAVAYFVSTATCVAAAYAICYSQSDHRAYPSLLAWLTSYAADSGFTHSFAQLINPYLTSYLKLFAGGKLSLVREYFSAASCLAYIVCAAAVGVAVALFRQTRVDAAQPSDRRLRIVLWAWFVPCAIFLACWDPGSTFHKLFVWPAIILLIGAYLPQTRANAFVAMAVALAAWNFAAFIYPHSHASADPVLILAQRVDHELPKNAIVYYRAFSPDDWYLDYFAPGRKWIQITSLDEIAATPGPVCFDTTALEALKPIIPRDAPKWDLVNRQHNVRLECRR